MVHARTSSALPIISPKSAEKLAQSGNSGSSGNSSAQEAFDSAPLSPSFANHASGADAKTSLNSGGNGNGASSSSSSSSSSDPRVSAQQAQSALLHGEFGPRPPPAAIVNEPERDKDGKPIAALEPRITMLSLLYDPPIEGCELRPYVAVR